MTERPIGFPEALRVLWSWKGKCVKVTVSNRQGRELTSVAGVLSDHSAADRVEFGVDDPSGSAAPVPVPLNEPYSCALGDGCVRITTAGELVVLFAFGEQPA